LSVNVIVSDETFGLTNNYLRALLKTHFSKINNLLKIKDLKIMRIKNNEFLEVPLMQWDIFLTV